MNYADVLSQTYTDTCNIYRYEDTESKGITRQSEVLKYSSVRCALSQGSLVKGTGENVTEISASAKVFFCPDVDIQEGDKLEITQQGARNAKVYKAGEVFRYDGSHIEVRVSRNDLI